MAAHRLRVLAAGAAGLPPLQDLRHLPGLRPVRRPWMRVRVRGLTALRHHQPNAGLVVAEGPDSPARREETTVTSKFIADKVGEAIAAMDAGNDQALAHALIEAISENDAPFEQTVADMTDAARRQRGE